MSERPKSLTEIANELLRKSNPREMMKELSRRSPSLDDGITNEMTRAKPEQTAMAQNRWNYFERPPAAVNKAARPSRLLSIR